METSYLKTLELDKIIARAAEGCVCKESREKLLAIEPQCDPDEVRYALEQTDAINSLLIKNGSPRFGMSRGRQSAGRPGAVKGGVPLKGELLWWPGRFATFRISSAGMALRNTMHFRRTTYSMRWLLSRASSSRSRVPSLRRMQWQIRHRTP